MKWGIVFETVQGLLKNPQKRIAKIVLISYIILCFFNWRENKKAYIMLGGFNYIVIKKLFLGKDKL